MSQHCFRGSRRHAARGRQEATIFQLKLELAQARVNNRFTWNQAAVDFVPQQTQIMEMNEKYERKAMESEELATHLEKCVFNDGPHKADDSEAAPVSEAHLEAAMQKGYEMGIRLVDKVREELENLAADYKLLAAKYGGLVTRLETSTEKEAKYEEQLKDAKTKETKMKDMLSKTIKAQGHASAIEEWQKKTEKLVNEIESLKGQIDRLQKDHADDGSTGTESSVEMEDVETMAYRNPDADKDEAFAARIRAMEELQCPVCSKHMAYARCGPAFQGTRDCVLCGLNLRCMGKEGRLSRCCMQHGYWCMGCAVELMKKQVAKSSDGGDEVVASASGHASQQTLSGQPSPLPQETCLEKSAGRDATSNDRSQSKVQRLMARSSSKAAHRARKKNGRAKAVGLEKNSTGEYKTT